MDKQDLIKELRKGIRAIKELRLKELYGNPEMAKKWARLQQYNHGREENN